MAEEIPDMLKLFSRFLAGGVFLLFLIGGITSKSMPIILLSFLGFFLALPHSNKLTQKYMGFKIPTGFKVGAMILIIFVILLVGPLSAIERNLNSSTTSKTEQLVQISDAEVTATKNQASITSPVRKEQFNYAKDCSDKWVLHYRERSPFPNPAPIMVLNCLRHAAIDNNDLEICEQLRTLRQAEIDMVLGDTGDYGPLWDGCAFMTAVGDYRSSDECFKDIRSKFLDSRVNLCKEEFRTATR